MYIIVSQEMPNIHGQMDHRPVAAFNSMRDARIFLRILAANQIYGHVRIMEA